MQTCTMSGLKNRSIANGSHWFSPSSMRFFNTRLPQVALSDGTLAWFVTSEAMSLDTVRKYSVRCYCFATNMVETVGDFHSYKTRKAAESAMRKAIKSGINPHNREV